MARRRVVRRLLGSALAVVGLLAVAALSLPLWLGPIAERQIATMIARPVSIGGLRLHPEQPLLITAEDVVVGNPPGFPSGEEPFARTPRATVRLDALTSLRQREVVITSIELHQPVLHVVATENGRDNYSDLINAAGAGGVEALIRSIRILDGKARVVLAGLHTEFKVVFSTDEGQGSAARILAEAHGTYTGQPIAARFTGGPPLDLSDASRPWPVDLQVGDGPTRVSGQGHAAGSAQPPRRPA